MYVIILGLKQAQENKTAEMIMDYLAGVTVGLAHKAD